jgi:hypothetical protein
MKPTAFIGLALIVAAPAVSAAQTQTMAPPPRFASAPWWMDLPIIASTGQVHAETPANRAGFGASFDEIDDSVANAMKKAVARMKTLTSVLAAYGADKVQVETSFTTRPLYEQYRDKSGQMVDNERPDKIDHYQVTARVQVNVRDVRVLEQVYATVLSAKPTSTDRVDFSLDPDDEVKTEMFRKAVANAADRARLAVQAAGARLGPVKLIDPTGRACQTDVLVAGAEAGYGEGVAASVPAPPPPAMASVNEVVVAGAKRAADAGLKPEDYPVLLQPPLQGLDASACVVFSLAP